MDCRACLLMKLIPFQKSPVSVGFMIKRGDSVLLRDKKWRCSETREQQKLFFSVWLRLIDLPPSRSLIWWKLICSLWVFDRLFASAIFHCVSSPSGSPVMKEKATEPEPRQQATVDTDVIETGYWYSQSWPPGHLGSEPLLLCTPSAGSSLHSWFLWKKCSGLLSFLIFMLSRFSHERFAEHLSTWRLNAESESDFWSFSLVCNFNWTV